MRLIRSPVLFTRHSTLATTAGSLPRAVTILDSTEAVALRARLEAIVKKAKDAEAQAAAARHRVQAAHLLLEDSKAPTLEQTATAARQRVPSSSSSSSSPAAASQLVPTASSTLRRHGRRRTSPSGGRSAQRPLAGEHHPRLLHQLRQLA
jgi:hypothetical protein